jgi:hypothetical protein
MRSGILFKEVDSDLRIAVPASLRSQVIRQAHERRHFPIAKTEALLNKKYWIPNIRDKIRRLLEIAFLVYQLKRNKVGRKDF